MEQTIFKYENVLKLVQEHGEKRRVALPHGGMKGVSKNTVLMDIGLDWITVCKIPPSDLNRALV